MKWQSAPRPRMWHARVRPFRIRRLLAAALLTATAILRAQELVPAPVIDLVPDYLEAIARAESEGGAYAAELVDLYHGMGQSLLEQGELEAARDAFHQTVMVTRVNSGPNSLEQANYLYGVAEIEFRLGDAEAAVKALEHIYRIHARHHGEDNSAMLPVVEQLYAWYTERLTWNTAPVSSSDFQNASYLAGRIAHLTEAEYGLGHARTALSYRALGQAHLQAVRYLVGTREPPEPDLVMNSYQTIHQSLLDRSVVHHFLEGEDALKRAVEAWQQNPDGTELQVAEAIAQLGDWNLALEYYSSAEHKYEQAYRLLADSADFAPVADEYLGSPAPLRLLDTTGRSVRNPDLPVATGKIEVSMTVTRHGRLQDIEIVKAPAGVSEAQLQEVRELLEATRFRPAVINGKVQTVEGFVWKTSPQLSKGTPGAG